MDTKPSPAAVLPGHAYRLRDGETLIARAPAADGSIEFYAPAAVRHTVVLLSAEQVATHLRTGQLRKVS